jgi:hypothetical protein
MHPEMHKPKGQANKGHQQSDPKPRKSTIIRIFGTLKRHYHRYKRATEHQKNERITARWTRNLGYLTIVLALIAGFTAVVLYETDQTARAGMRAYVTSSELLIETIRAKDGRVINWLVSPVVENAGNTSTENARIGIGLKFWFAQQFPGTAPPNEPTDRERLNQQQFRNIVLGPRVKVSKNVLPIHIDAVSLPVIRSGEQRLFVVGEVDYDDVFHTDHVTKFCYVIWAYPEGEGIEGITYSLCAGRSNCTDTECRK